MADPHKRDEAQSRTGADDAPTAAQLKREHETGAHRDKIAYPDPGASPLGTDDEAAGRPANPERVALSAAGAPDGAQKPFEPIQSAPRADPQEDPAPRVDTSGRFQFLVFGGVLTVIIAALLIRMALG
ncbi:MAG: hypothetical protein ACFE0P_07135 [Oceanicaulis sp.]